MKKTISLLLVLVMCLALCACGAPKITAETVEKAFESCEGTLELETSGDKVTGFTYTVQGVNADDLVDKSYAREAIASILTGDTSKITVGQIKVGKGLLALMAVEVLFNGDDKDFSSSALVEKLLSAASDGTTLEYGEWKVSVEVKLDTDSIVIKAAS